MGISTCHDYIERLRKQKPKLHMAGERIGNIVDDPRFQVGINSIAVTYDSANDPSYRDLAITTSPLIKEPVSLWTHILEDERDAIAKVKLMRRLGEYCCFCNYRCITHDCLTAAWATSYDIDQKYGTGYHQRVRETVERVQKGDLVIGGTIVDPKGDRSLRPSQQPDPDVYLHVVERKSDGIVVRGAKCHSTAAVYTDMLCALPSGPLREDEKDFAVAFFAPVDTEGVTFLCRPSTVPTEAKKIENPLSTRFGHVELLTVYDNVFVPWENVFMCGEWEFAGPLMRTFSGSHILSKCGCRSAAMELDIGATALIADMNGVARAAHIREYINEMMMNTEIVYSCGIAAAVDGAKHPSGVFLSRGAPAFTAKVYAAKKLGEHRYFMQDTAGGLVQTMSLEKDYLNPETGKLMDKYLRGKSDVPTEDRIRAFKLIEDLTASPYAGWYHAMSISGGGGPQLLKQTIQAEYDLPKLIRRARRIAGIEP